MRRGFWPRLLAGWLACWLPLVLADGGWLQACPMHDAVGGATAAAMVMAGAPGGHADHEAGRRHGPAGHCCTCLGACCAAVAVLPVHPSVDVVATTEWTFVPPTARPEHEYVAAWVDFVLPFATAPPEAAAA